jgi:threonyl-tRNA synthetase
MRVVLPDGSAREVDQGSTGAQIAMRISPGLAKASVAIKVNGVLRDLSDPITEDASISLVTVNDEDGLEIMRHTIAAQVLARAVKNLYPGAKLAIGPTIRDGFYYDVAFKEPISVADLPAIEEEMKRIAKTGSSITKKIYDRDGAKALFGDRGEEYKVAIINDSDEGEGFQIYHQDGTDFIDLCRGPHLPSFAHIGAFKLLKVAGAYWRGKSDNEMLTRIYGTAWKSNKELNAYLLRIEEAEKRDHRKLGQEMDLFHFQPETPGQVFWHNNGWTIYRQVENYIRGKLRVYDYDEVNTPRVVSKDLFVKSGHWEKFGTDEMFVTQAYGEQTFALKPMNCPCHVQIFNHSLRSYRDLPIRMSEFGNCFRQEARGALHGLMRVASMAQDDAHIFCRMDQIKDEIVGLNGLIKEIYAELGFDSFFVRFSDRPEQRVGDDSVWDAAENALQEACKAASIEWIPNPGEGAFYGPKLEFVLRDAIGREWQCGTIQLDFNLPQRLEATYIDEKGEKQYPVMIHRALVGTLERFVGILIEHYGGNFPLWLAPRQVVLSSIIDSNNDHVRAVAERFKATGIRCEVDVRNEKINYKIREHMAAKVSFVGVLGDREARDDTVTVRRLGEGNKTTNLPVNDFIARIREEIDSRALPPTFNPAQLLT